jgi:hypothetical protein
MIGRLVAVAGLVALAFGVWALWPRGEPDTTPSTTVVAAPNTTTSLPATTSTSTPGSTTTTGASSHVVTTVEEAEEILRDLWFGWFEGIYNQDEDRIKEVVGSQSLLENARTAFGTPSEQEPRRSDFDISDIEILRADEECLAVWATLDASSYIGSPATETSVHVLRRPSEGWVFVAFWINKDDLWEADCESQLEPLQ